MKRRAGRSPTGSLDSLLDTMTNVVGILIIMLIVTQLQVGDAVERIKGFVQQISPEELADLEVKSSELNALLSAETSHWQELQIDEEKRKLSIQEQRKLIADIKKDLQQLANNKVDPKQIKQQIDARSKEVANLEQNIENNAVRLVSLRARLSKTPTAPAANAKVVTLPNPRAAPPGVQPFDMLCFEGRVRPIFEANLLKRCQQRIVRRRRLISTDEGLIPDRLIQMFETDRVEDPYFRIKIQVNKGVPYAIFEPRLNSGETAEDILGGKPLMRAWLTQLDKERQYIRFRVCTDSFEAYLAARSLASQGDWMAGWIPYATSYRHRVRLDKGFVFQGKEVKLKCIGYTPPPPPKKPTPKPTPKPAPKKTTPKQAENKPAPKPTPKASRSPLPIPAID